MSYLVSIVIVSFNNLSLTRKCLHSIYARTDRTLFEVIIVDNASHDHTPEYLEEFAAGHDNCRVIYNSDNKGFPAAVNQGAAAASGKYLVIMHNDTLVSSGWLEPLISSLENSTVGMVGAVTNNSDTETRIAVTYSGIEDMNEFAKDYVVQKKGQVIDVENLPFLCAALRKEVFEEIGPLDEGYGLGLFESDDYSYRLKQKGYRLLCVEDAYVHHEGRAAFSLAGFEGYWLIFQKNRQYFEEKWGVVWHPVPYRPELAVDLIGQMREEKIALSLQLAAEQKYKREIEETTSWQMIWFLRQRMLRLAPSGTLRSSIFGKMMRIMSGTAKFTFQTAYRVKSSYKHLKIRRQTAAALKRLSQRLQAILEEHSGAEEIIVFVPTISWKAVLFQRPHQMALAFARQGSLVFFIDPPEDEKYPEGFHKMAERLYVIGSGPLDFLQQLNTPVVFTLIYNTAYLENFISPRVVYEFIDELSIFPGDEYTNQKLHKSFLHSSALVVATADHLKRQVEELGRDTLLVPNAVDHHFLKKSLDETQEPPVELVRFVQQQRPIIGYYGALAHWVDYDLLKAAAILRPEYPFVLIGPDYDGSIQKIGVHALGNVSWLGPRPYQQLPGYLKYFNAATIPFRLNDVTHSTSPLKLFEYMMARKPVVTTPMHECQKYAPVLIGHTPEEFVEKLDLALTLQNDAGYLASLEQVAM
jgi:GT2 family glycosyltransferase/glycosyltransferase involved in cell wall biosynthesis